MNVSVTQIVEWECPYCEERNYDPGWIMPGDKLDCKYCKSNKIEVRDVYLDCRPVRKRLRPVDSELDGTSLGGQF